MVWRRSSWRRCVLPDATFRIVRSRRTTIAITVSAGSVVVRAPFGVSDESIRAFVVSKRAWIDRKLEEYTGGRFASVRNGESILDAGVERAVHFGANANGEGEDGFYFRGAASVRRYFERTRGPILIEALFVLSRRVGVSVTDVKLRDFKSRWGSCDERGVICLNWRLSMLPIPLRDYVLIHELCHRRRLDHSPAFWREVSRYCTGVTSLRRQLRDYAFLSLLYRRGRGEERE